jgi:hypothetical protein
MMQKLFDLFGPGRRGQIVGSVVVMMAFSAVAWDRMRRPGVSLWGMLLYGGAMGLVAGVVLAFFPRRRT